MTSPVKVKARCAKATTKRTKDDETHEKEKVFFRVFRELYAYAAPTMIFLIRTHGDPCEMLLVWVG